MKKTSDDDIRFAVGVSPDEKWIDTHSVTCALCGGYADERESESLWEKDDFPNGEAHSKCYLYARENSIKEARSNLVAVVHR